MPGQRSTPWWGAMAFSIAFLITFWIFVQMEKMDESRFNSHGAP